MRLILTTAIFVFLSFQASAQMVGLIDREPGSLDGYILFSPNSYPAHYLIDKCGKLVKKWNVANVPGLDAYLLPDATLLSTGKLTNSFFPGTGTAGGLIEKYDWKGKRIWSYIINDSIDRQDHDVFPMPNGHILVAVWERHTQEDALNNGRDTVNLPPALWSAKVMEIVPRDTAHADVVWVWRLWDHLVQEHDTSKRNYGAVAQHPELLNINYNGSGPAGNAADWIHLNAVNYNADLDQIVISSRNLSEIWIIDHSTTTSEAAGHTGGKHGKGGDFLYRWGNPAAYNHGTVLDEKLFVQHDPAWIPKGCPDAGKISIFSNGTGRPDGNYTTIEVIDPPMNAKGDYTLGLDSVYGPKTSSWTYANKTTFYSSVQGGAQRLPNGNTLICEATKGNFFEIDSTKSTVWRYLNPVSANGPIIQGEPIKSNAVFRCTWYGYDYPAFDGLHLLAGDPIELLGQPYDCEMEGNNSIMQASAAFKNNFRIISPFSDALTVFSNADIAGATLQLSDMQGRVLDTWSSVSFSSGAAHALQLSKNITPGIYLLNIKTRKEEFSQKVVAR